MKKFLFLLVICSFLFANCKTTETENDITSEYYNILNQNTLSVEEKCAKITELFIKEHNIKTALSVSVKNEKINFYKNYGVSSLSSKSVCDSETLHYIYSITKTFTSALTLSLCEENILNLKETVEHHLPELFTENYAGSKDLNLYINKDASIEQLLNHTSGIYDFAKNSRLYNTTNNIFSKPWNPELILDYIEHPKEKNRNIFIFKHKLRYSGAYNSKSHRKKSEYPIK